jgi:tRNA pseudouridine55 synthase
MDGVLVVDKPGGMTSFDVVRQIRHAARIRRVGHGGTLDPLASGVLPICLGEATKLAQFLLEADKAYQATLCFGVETDSYDADGQVTRRCDTDGVSAEALAAALDAFRGVIRQRPPAFSALKHQGEPLYAYARRGEPVEAPERTVTIHELTLVTFQGPQAVTLQVRCSKGTYIRSLAFDLGRALGSGAHLTALRRTQSGPFTLASARPLGTLVDLLRATASTSWPLVGLSDVLGHLPRLSVDDATALAVVHGKAVPWPALAAQQGQGAISPPPGRFQLLAGGGGLLAVAEVHPDGLVRTVRVFNAAQVSAEPRKNLSA